jgi:hypothetical protein
MPTTGADDPDTTGDGDTASTSGDAASATSDPATDTTAAPSTTTSGDHDDSDMNGQMDLIKIVDPAPLLIVGSGVSTCAPVVPQ